MTGEEIKEMVYSVLPYSRVDINDVKGLGQKRVSIRVVHRGVVYGRCFIYDCQYITNYLEDEKHYAAVEVERAISDITNQIFLERWREVKR